MEALHLLDGFGFGGCEKRLVAGIERAGIHEILPDHEAQFVAEVVKCLVLVDAAAPDAHHVHVGIGGGLERRLVVLALQSVGEDMIRNPVGPLGEDGTTVDQKSKTRAELIRRLVERDRAQADAALPAVEHAAVSQEFQLHLVERLIPMTVRPPEFGRRNLRLKAAGFGHDFAIETNTQTVDCFSIFCRQFRRKAQDDAVFAVLLGDVDMPETVFTPCLEFDRAEDAAGEIPRTPVPAEIALGLADLRTSAHRIAPSHLAGIKTLAPPRDLRQDAAECDLQNMCFLPVDCRKIPSVPDKHVVGFAKRFTVESDFGQRVESVCDQLQMFSLARSVKFVAIHPIPLSDPSQLFFPLTAERIGNHAMPEEIGVNASGHGGGEPASGFRLLKHPARGE